MATRLKTVEYWFPHLATAVDNADTNFTQITVYLPESSKTFRKVVVEVCAHDRNTTVANVTNRNIDVQLAAAGYTSVDNASTLTGAGEQMNFGWSGDFTSYFTTNWTGTSMTMDLRVLCNDSGGTPLNPSFNNFSARVVITFEYDDTSTTHVKTVWVPLNAPLTALAASKPGTAHDTIPDLADYLPEAGKTFRQTTIVVQGNTEGGAVTDKSLSFEVDTLGAFTSQLYEHGSNTDLWYRLNQVVTFTTTAVHDFFVWASATDFDHPQVYLVVTYEFEADNVATTLTEDLDGSETGVDVTSAAALGTAPYTIIVDDEHMLVTSVASNTLTVTRGHNGSSATTHSNGATVRPGVICSLLLPVEFGGSFGGTTSSDYQRAERELWVQELAPRSRNMAVLVFWDQAAAIAGLNMRFGTGSFNAITSVGSVLSGGCGALLRNDSGFTLARGRNSMNVDAYRSDTADLGYNTAALFMVNYVAAQPTAGHGAENHTVIWNVRPVGTGAASTETIVSSVAMVIPETNWFATAVGVHYLFTSNSTSSPAGVHLGVERLASGEGGLVWENVYEAMGGTDPEPGIRQAFATARSVFNRWAGDPSGRLDIETARRWRISTANSATSFDYVDILFTYHSITYTVGDDVENSNGGTVELTLHRDATGEKVLETSRSGNGAYSFTWYDNTEPVYVVGYEDDDFKGRSGSGVATGSP